VAHVKSSYGRILDAVKLTLSRFTRRDFLVEGHRMNERPVPSRGPEVGRWVLVAMLILVGIALYFWFAPSSPPAAPPGVSAE
jgi:hypothetical protein